MGQDDAPAPPQPQEERPMVKDVTADMLRVLAHVEVDRIFDELGGNDSLVGALKQLSEVLVTYEKQLAESKTTEQSGTTPRQSTNRRAMYDDANRWLRMDGNRYVREGENRYIREGENRYVREGENRYVREGENRYVREDENRYVREGENRYVREDENRPEAMNRELRAENRMLRNIQARAAARRKNNDGHGASLEYENY